MKKLQIRLCLSVLLVSIVGVTCALGGQGNDAAIEEAVKKFLNAKNDAKVTGKISDLANVADDSALNNTTAAIKAERKAMAEGGEKYSGSKTSVKMISEPKPLEDGTFAVEAEEYSTLIVKSGQEQVVTEELTEHVLTLKNEGGKWKVIGDKVKNEPTPQPLPDGEEPVPYDFPDTLPTPKAYKGTEESFDPSELAVAASAIYYNGSAAANYAYTWALSRNSAYRYFPGADCTNFVSQSVRAGNWWMISGYYTYTTVWWYNSLNQSRTWINAHSWYTFTKNRPRGTIAQYFSNLRLGDILQMDFDRNGTIDHSMVVTYKSSTGVIYLSYHTTDTRNKSINTILSQYPSAAYYGWLIKSPIP